jgi:hypothetical protein
MLYEGREERPPIARLPVGAGERRSGALVRWSAGPSLNLLAETHPHGSGPALRRSSDPADLTATAGPALPWR